VLISNVSSLVTVDRNDSFSASTSARRLRIDSIEFILKDRVDQTPDFGSQSSASEKRV
jgi:hypothetical protein